MFPPTAPVDGLMDRPAGRPTPEYFTVPPLESVAPIASVGRPPSLLARWAGVVIVTGPLRVQKIGVIAPGEAWERGKGCNEYTSETFRRGPGGSQSHPVERAGGRKRVLRGGGRPPSRSVDSQAESSD